MTAVHWSKQLLVEDVNDLSCLAVLPNSAAVIAEQAAADVHFPLTLPQVRHYSLAHNFPGSLCEFSRIWKGAAHVCWRFSSFALSPWMWPTAEVQTGSPGNQNFKTLSSEYTPSLRPLGPISYELREKRQPFVSLIYFVCLYFLYIFCLNQNRTANLKILTKWRYVYINLKSYIL